MTISEQQHIPLYALKERISVGITLLHYGHDGQPGSPDGSCPRCNADRALDELVRRHDALYRERIELLRRLG